MDPIAPHPLSPTSHGADSLLFETGALSKPVGAETTMTTTTTATEMEEVASPGSSALAQIEALVENGSLSATTTTMTTTAERIVVPSSSSQASNGATTSSSSSSTGNAADSSTTSSSSQQTTISPTLVNHTPFPTSFLSSSASSTTSAPTPTNRAAPLSLSSAASVSSSPARPIPAPPPAPAPSLAPTATASTLSSSSSSASATSPAEGGDDANKRKRRKLGDRLPDDLSLRAVHYVTVVNGGRNFRWECKQCMEKGVPQTQCTGINSISMLEHSKAVHAEEHKVEIEDWEKYRKRKPSKFAYAQTGEGSTGEVGEETATTTTTTAGIGSVPPPPPPEGSGGSTTTTTTRAPNARTLEILSEKSLVFVDGVRMFECDVCQRRFRERTKLRRHMLVHTGTRAFVCDMCGASFAYNANLKTHVRIHTGERPYLCTVPGCGKSFAQATNRNSHVNTHFVVSAKSVQTQLAKKDESETKKQRRLERKKKKLAEEQTEETTEGDAAVTTTSSSSAAAADDPSPPQNRRGRKRKPTTMVDMIVGDAALAATANAEVANEDGEDGATTGASEANGSVADVPSLLIPAAMILGSTGGVSKRRPRRMEESAEGEESNRAPHEGEGGGDVHAAVVSTIATSDVANITTNETTTEMT